MCQTGNQGEISRVKALTNKKQKQTLLLDKFDKIEQNFARNRAFWIKTKILKQDWKQDQGLTKIRTKTNIGVRF